MATGNVTGNFILGNITFASGYNASRIFNGTSEANIGSTNGNANISINGTSNVVVVANTGLIVSGTVSASGTVTGGNLQTAGTASATGNVTGGNIITGGLVTATGNVNASGGVLASGNITGANINTGGLVSATGNITGNNIFGVIRPTAGSGTAGIIFPADPGTGSGDLATIKYYPVVGEATVLELTVTNDADDTIKLNATGGTDVTGNLRVTGTISGPGSGLSSLAGANVTGTVANATYATSAGSATTAGTVTTAAQPNITSVGTLTSLSVSGNITGGNLSVGIGTINVGNIVNTNANGVGNIGSATTYFNRVFATATTALYADLAEKFLADQPYEPGTVLVFGGDKEVTISVTDSDHRVAGVVSSEPSYLMNSGLTGDYAVELALQGRVPCKVFGPVAKGDLLVSAANGHAQAVKSASAGTIIGKSLQNFDGTTGVIEIVVGRD